MQNFAFTLKLSIRSGKPYVYHDLGIVTFVNIYIYILYLYIHIYIYVQ